QPIDFRRARVQGRTQARYLSRAKIDSRDPLEKGDIERTIARRQGDSIRLGELIGVGPEEDFQRVEVGPDAVQPSLLRIGDVDVAIRGNREIIKEMAGSRI